MPSFDIVSNVDKHELTNAVDQANREVQTRFDFKGSRARFDLASDYEQITLVAPSEFQIKQMMDILQNKLAKRNLDLRILDPQKMEGALHETRQELKIRQGINQENAKKITKLIREQKMKVQAAIQGDQVRVSGKKRDDLQTVIELIKEKKLELPLQFVNFRD
jgi:uncharacterized protein YajQ (UPF0234 family)